MPDVGAGRSRTELERDDIGLGVTIPINSYGRGSIGRDPNERDADEDWISSIGHGLERKRVRHIIRTHLTHGLIVNQFYTPNGAMHLSEVIVD